MKKLFYTIILLFVFIATFAQQLPGDKIVCTWESTDSDIGLRFEIYKSGDKYFGKLLWASIMYEADEKTPKKDFKNPDIKLRNRSRENIVNITNLKYENGEYTGGKLYNPDDGNTYSLKATLKSADHLEFRGYKGITLLGKTMNFKRIQ